MEGLDEATEVLKSISEHILRKVVSSILSVIDMSTSIAHELQKKLTPERQGLTFQIWYLPDLAFEMLDELIGRGLDPTQARPSKLLRALRYTIGLTRFNVFNVWQKSTVEGLVSRGILSDCDAIPCADDQICEKALIESDTNL